jgi:nifR3 family TIM-barrel protein
MGCPARKIVRGAAGAALMADLELARRIIRAMRRAVSIPLTVKFRAGVHAAALTDVELGHICEGEGVDAVTLHPRTARQQYSGHADWSRIARLKESLQIPVVGNGDVRTAEDAARMFRDTGCDAVMIGRAALTNPWIFRQSADLFAGQAVRDPSPQERVALVRHHVAILEGELEGDELLHKLKVLTRWFTHSLAGGRRLRQRLSLLHDAGELVAEIRSFLDAAVAGTSGEEPRTDDRAFPER